MDSSLFLFARLVDAAGQPVQATDVVAVRCSVRELGTREADVEFDVNPCEIISPTLVVGDAWTVDNVGHNFRHDLSGVVGLLIAVAPEFSGRVEVRYVFTLIDCISVVVSFHLKLM